MSIAIRASSYGKGEFLLAYGPQDGPQLLILQPFFEEMNRSRMLVAALCRALASRGIGSRVPDLPGTGESLRALEEIGWDDWLQAVQLNAGADGIVSLRGGALLDSAIPGRRWRFAPISGRSLLSDLRRSALVGGGDPTVPAGYPIPANLALPLQMTDVVTDHDARTIRLVSDDRPADRHVEGTPVWRRPEPAHDARLAAVLTEDIDTWIRS